MIGTAPQAVSALEYPGQVIYGCFDLPSAEPLNGAVTVTDFLAGLEADPSIAPLLAKARVDLGAVIDRTGTLRDLRLAAGLSQAKLAALADTTQTYVARVEAGNLDPGTDMLARLASALSVSDASVFSAVRLQRTQKELQNAG